MVGHMLDIIMSLMQDRLQDEMCLSREENFNSSNTFLSQYVKANPLSTSEIGAAGLCTHCAHKWTPKLFPPLCTVWGGLRVLQQEEQVAGPEMTVPPLMPTGHSQQHCWHRDLLASQHRLLSTLSPIFSLFSLFKDCCKTSMPQICAPHVLET